MTVSFDSIVKSENSLREGRKIIRGFSLVQQSLPWQEGNRPTIRPERRHPANQRKAECHDGQSGFAINDKNGARRYSRSLEETF
jgi:hypothetical protein|tara:strand:+ start:225 stop:476 length:252 start_codon:yes stop_codon:yes gene_type:complete